MNNFTESHLEYAFCEDDTTHDVYVQLTTHYLRDIPELALANPFEKSEDIKLYEKFPDGFKIGTPLDTYNPD